MKKEYNHTVTPHNTPSFTKRKIVFMAAMILLIANLTVFSIVLKAARVFSAMLAVLFLVWSVVIYFFEKRTAEWKWASVVGSVLIYAFISIAYIWAFSFYVFIYVMVAQIIFFAVFCIWLFRNSFRKKG